MDIYLYSVPADSQDLQLWPEYLHKHLDQTKQHLQGLIGQGRENGTSRYYSFSDYADPSIPDTYLYWVPADSRDSELWPEYLHRHLDQTKQHLPGVKDAKVGQVGTTASVTILIHVYPISTSTHFHLSPDTWSFDLSTFTRTLT